jgi:lysophospholipase L1-like esterase
MLCSSQSAALVLALVVSLCGVQACTSQEQPRQENGSGGTAFGGAAFGGAPGSGAGGTPGASGLSGSPVAGKGSSGNAGSGSGAAAGKAAASGGSANAGGGGAATAGAGGSGGLAGVAGAAAGTAAGNGGASAGTAGSDAGGTGGAGSGVFPPNVTRPRIMIVGDSISAGPGCYKKYLLEKLTNAGLTSYEFVGEYADDCGGGVRHSAVSCTTSANYTQASFTVPNCNAMTYPGMASLVEEHNPDLVMLQLGVNDVWGGSAPIQPILSNYETLIAQARAHNPNVVVMVAQIHKIITDNCSNTASTTNAEQLVMAVPAWAAGVSTAQSPVLVADLWTNSDAHEADDCVHPNDAGARRMGENWFAALAPILN